MKAAAKKRVRPKISTTTKKKGRSTAAAKEERTYTVILRTEGVPPITPSGHDHGLYPKAVAWNRILSSDQGRQSNAEQEKQSWRHTGRQTFLDMAESGGVSAADANKFIDAAAASGKVQVELEWESEDFGYAARIFPWEALIALATKQQRELVGDKGMVVVRWLKGGVNRPTPAQGPVGFGVSAGAKKAGYDTATERAAIIAALRGKRKLVDLPAKSLDQLANSIREEKPSVIHYVSASPYEASSDRPRSGTSEDEGNLEKIAETVAKAGPELVAFSTCYSGRRLAPLAIAKGAQLAFGFHGFVTDASCAAFFGAFYRAWQQDQATPIEALRHALAANKAQPNPDDLGTVVLWSSTDLLIAQPKRALAPTKRKTGDTKAKDKQDDISRFPSVAEALPVDCKLETSLNYSMLHNKSGGIFKSFAVTKLPQGKMDDLEVSVRFDNGIERVAECRFFAPLREEANSMVDLAPRVMLPLGSELLRRRGEMIRGTVEITIKSGTTQVFHQFDSIELPPCDEWKDDSAGRRFLPSFIFPRDPAVRDILTAAQPFLRALTDDPIAGFDGYQGGFAGDGVEAVRGQLRAIWTALQSTCRLDYVNPPPSYIGGVQRLRTPEEVLRARRGTCIELVLLLAACWEHIGIHPVILLIPGHAFTGYWVSETAWQNFFEEFVARAESVEPTKMGIDDAEDISGGGAVNPNLRSGGGLIRKDEAWVLKGLHHLALIHREVTAKRLIPVEATAVALQKSFGMAEREGTDLLLGVRRIEDFDGMIDGQKARKEGVTPLAILTQNVVA